MPMSVFRWYRPMGSTTGYKLPSRRDEEVCVGVSLAKRCKADPRPFHHLILKRRRLIAGGRERPCVRHRLITSPKKFRAPPQDANDVWVGIMFQGDFFTKITLRSHRSRLWCEKIHSTKILESSEILSKIRC